MRIRYFWAMLIFLNVIASVSGVDSAHISFSIRYYNKQIYFPESDILLKITLKNDSAVPYRFKLANDRIYNFDFDVRSMANRRISYSSDFISRRNMNKPVYYREVSLEPGEEFSVIENLSDYIQITESGMYNISGNFYPDLIEVTNDQMLSNRLQLLVRPSHQQFAEAEIMIDQLTGEILKRNPLPPDEVVAHTIVSRQRGKWENFFLYFDMEALYTRDSLRDRMYTAMSEEKRIESINTYKENLKAEVVDTDIIVIPSEFEIVKTSYTPRSATVEANLRFQYETFTEIKKYTYYLERNDTVWYIVDYVVQNIGTE